MKRTLLIALCLSTLITAAAQSPKCGIDTRALVAEEVASGATTVRMLAKMVPGFDRGILEKAGIRIGAQAGQIVTLTVPVEALPLLESHKEVLQYSISHRIAAPMMDRARRDTRTDSVHNGLGTASGLPYNGEGVYIGITDWGFDYTHPNYNAAGVANRRLLMAWDQFRKAGPAPDGFDYGTLISGYQNLKNARGDTSNIYGYGTHGTHVAGIAAGKGSDTIFAGQAPRANLLFCTFRLGEAEWMDGVAWMRQVAADSARRLVVNSSWGMYTFSTLDGTSLLSQAIDSWANEGTVFVTSGGNNGYSTVPFHISRNFASTPDTLRTVAVKASEIYSIRETGQALVLWGEENHDFQALVRIASGGQVYTSPILSTASGDTVIYDTILVGETPIAYRAMIEHANPFDRRPHMQLDVNKTAGELQLFITAPTGTVHAWNIANKENHAGNEGCSFSSAGHHGFTSGDNLYGIGEPACSRKTLSIAAHAADRYNSATHQTTIGGLAPFSSSGPTIDGRQKPEISAPGVDINSSISYWTTDHYDETAYHWIFDKKYIWSTMSGTSMSSPSVAGIMALLLQANPDLTVDEIRDIVFTTARNDEKTGPLVANDSTDLRWGWGKINALAAVNKALSMVSIEQAEQHRLPIRIFPNPAADRVTVHTGCGQQQMLEVYSIDGRQVMRTPVATESTLDLSGWQSGVYILRLGSRTAKLIVQ